MVKPPEKSICNDVIYITQRESVVNRREEENVIQGMIPVMDTLAQPGSGCRGVPPLPRVEGASSPWTFPYGAVTE